MNLLGNEGNTGSGTDPNSWKAIWSGPGSNFSKITAVLAVCGLGYGFYKALPFLITAASNTIVFVAELALLVLLLSMLTSKRFWKIISVGWRMVTKKILGCFVKIDPISILENGIAELQEQFNNVCDNVTKLAGVLTEMEKNLNKYKNEFTACIRKRDAAKKMIESGKLSPDRMMEIKSGYVCTCNDIARFERLIGNQQKRIDVAEKYLAVMKRIKIAAKFKINDAQSSLRFQKEDYKAAKAQLSAIGAIKAIMNGNAGGLEYDLALEHVNDTVNLATAQMKELLDGSNDLLVNFDLETYANLDKVDEIVTRFEKTGFDSFKSEDGRSAADIIDVPFMSGIPELSNDKNTVYAADIEKSLGNMPEPVPAKKKYF